MMMMIVLGGAVIASGPVSRFDVQLAQLTTLPALEKIGDLCSSLGGGSEANIDD